VINFFRSLFSTTGILIIIYVLIGVFTNTNPPHLPPTSGASLDLSAAVHSWIQYAISVMFWPLSFWSPTFTLGKWNA
jgi:hypothetical protein